MIDIRNRRYIGNKASLLQKINSATKNLDLKKDFSFADIFAGTGVVAYDFAKKGHPVIVNDFLFSNYVAYVAWFSDEKYDSEKLDNLIEYYNGISYDDLKENYFSKIYANKYYSVNDARKIGFIREDLEKRKSELCYREFCILLTSLMYAADKIANTVGHFEHYLKKEPVDSNFQMEKLNLQKINSAQIYNEDANELASKIKADVVYLDPPYNARQYVNFYHVLENLARWEKPTEFEGVSMKFKRDHLKSGYSRVEAPKLFKDLVNKLDCKYIIVSYNNTYNARSSASNNKIQEKELIDILKNKGEILC